MLDSDRMKSKDFISIGIAVFALAISAATAYFNLLRVSDDVRVVVGRTPLPSIDSVADTIHVDTPVDLTFINAGTRPAAISNLTYIVAADDGQRTCVNRQSSKYIFYDFEPLVVRSAEILARRYNRVQAIRGWKMTRNEEASVKNDKGLTRGQSVATCLRVEVVTPDTDRTEVMIPLFKIELLEVADPNGPLTSIPIDPMYKSGEPIPLVRKSAMGLHAP